ncbi:hypothetical protein [Sneathiella sp.]|jgi:hypothetical protein|uniref:hypothetical protein n=1 Tax=Sneathiella sp. TaxID=1964365 RepID=UPI0039E3FCCB
MQKNRINEMEAAKRLVNLAIKLHFSHTDPVGIHALTLSGYRLLHRLSNRAHQPDIVPEYLNYLAPDDRQFFFSSVMSLDPVTNHGLLSTIDRSYNYADEITDLILFICCALYRHLDNNHTHEMKIYIIWYKAINRLKEENDPIYNTKTKDGFDYLKSLPREKQLTLGYDALKNLRGPASPKQRTGAF